MRKYLRYGAVKISEKRNRLQWEHLLVQKLSFFYAWWVALNLVEEKLTTSRKA